MAIINDERNAENETLTALDLQIAFYRHTIQRYEIVAPNIYMLGTNEMDIFALRRSGYIDEIEIKLSKSDYQADFNKTVSAKSEIICYNKTSNNGGYHNYTTVQKHERLQAGKLPCNYFAFLMPEKLADICEIPDYAGLYIHYVDNAGKHRVTEKRAAKLLHKRKIKEWQKYDVGRKMACRYWDVVKRRAGHFD